MAQRPRQGRRGDDGKEGMFVHVLDQRAGHAGKAHRARTALRFILLGIRDKRVHAIAKPLNVGIFGIAQFVHQFLRTIDQMTDVFFVAHAIGLVARGRAG